MAKSVLERLVTLERKIKDLYCKVFDLKPKYKVFTALLTQDGVDNQLPLIDEPLTIGVTYKIGDQAGGIWDFTNVGAPNNDIDTYFVATGATPNSWGNGTLIYNPAAPTAIVLANTIGNIWFTYNGIGNYLLNSFLELPISTFTYIGDNIGKAGVKILINSIASPTVEIQISVLTTGDVGNDSQLINTPIEIRVYN
jgi:hypothetical protein